MPKAEKVLLKLVARAHSIIAQISKISLVPLDLKSEIFIPFSYFDNPFYHDEQRDLSSKLSKESEELRRLHFSHISTCVLTFEAVKAFISKLYQFLKDLDDGFFIQQTIDSLFMAEEGKQLLVESLFLLSVILLLLEMKFSGDIREKIIVAYCRWKTPSDTIEVTDDLKNIMKCLQKGETFPEGLFRRIKLYPDFAQKCIARLRTDDVFNQYSHYPDPNHRSVALSTQAAMIFLLLFYQPQILKEEYSVMREIVDKHFPDNWVVSVYLGRPIDISLVWEAYPAAKQAISNTMESFRLKKQVNAVLQKLPLIESEIELLLKEGTLTNDFLLAESQKIINAIRDGDCLLRFLLLHTFVKKTKPELVPLFNLKSQGKIVSFLFDLAQVELRVKEIVKSVLISKSEKFKGLQQEVSGRFVELGDYFGGKKVLTKVEKSEYLEKWFEDLSVQVKDLNFDDIVPAGRVLVQIVKALEEIQDYRQFDSYIHIKAFVSSTIDVLKIMIKLINISDSYLVTLNQVSEFSYASEIMPECIPFMQKLIKSNPSSVYKMRAIFLKMASSLDTPLFRMSDSSDALVNVSRFYSNELVKYVEKVLQIVPNSLFVLVDEMVLEDMPTRIDKNDILSYVRFDSRFKLSEITHKISCFTEGLLEMEKTLLGILEIDPRTVLDKGIRLELRSRLELSFNSYLTKNIPGTFEDKLKLCSRKLNEIRRSFAYLRDFLHIDTLKIWREEFIQVFQKSYQEAIQKKGFLRYILDELLDITSPVKSVFCKENRTWLDLRQINVSPEDFIVVFDDRQVSQLYKCLDFVGFRYLINILGVMLQEKVEYTIEHGIVGLMKNNSQLVDFFNSLYLNLGTNTESIPNGYASIYQNLRLKFPMFFQTSSEKSGKLKVIDWYEELSIIGQYLHLQDTLKFKMLLLSSTEAPILSSTLDAYHRAVISNVYIKSKKIGSSVLWPGSMNSQIGFRLLDEVQLAFQDSGVIRKCIRTLPDDQGEVLPSKFHLFMFCILFAELCRTEYIAGLRTFITGSIGNSTNNILAKAISRSNSIPLRDSGLVFDGWYCVCVQIEECAVSAAGGGERVLEKILSYLGQFQRSWYNSMNFKGKSVTEMEEKADVLENMKKIIVRLDPSLEKLSESRIL